MGTVAELKGSFSKTNIIEVFSEIIKSEISGCHLVINEGPYSKKIWIKAGLIKFVYTDDPDESYCNFLRTEFKIKETDLNKAIELKKKGNIRLGKACTSLGIMDYGQLWESVIGHQKFLLNSINNCKKGDYSIELQGNSDRENIRIDLPLVKYILEFIRSDFGSGKYSKYFDNIKEVYLTEKGKTIFPDLNPFESHILELLRKTVNVQEIINTSELNKDDTLKYIYYFFLIDMLTERKLEIKENSINADLNLSSSFSSYEEALRHYNIKFEMIFKLLTKEIGPVALSILSNSIDEIRDNLPVFLRSLEMDKNGKLNEKKVVKKMWYHDFESYSFEFVRGLEEVLYAQIYAVRKNLGIDYEHQVLKWLNGTRI